MSFTRRRFCAGLALSPIALGASGPATAQSLPAIVKVIVVVPPGATIDTVARVVAEKLKDSLHRTLVIEYKIGGTGLAAAEYLRSTPPDGSHLLFTPMPIASFTPFLYSKLSFDPDRDLAPVCDGVQVPVALTASLGTGVSGLKEFLELVRKDPKQGSVGTSSMSSIGAFIVLLLRKLAGVDLQLVAYKGGQPLLTDLLGNQIPAGMSVISDYLSHHRAGRVRILAASGATRSPIAPDIPTFTESGFPDLHGKSSIGFFVRGGTPRPIIEQYAAAINAAFKVAEVRTRLLGLGMEVIGGTPEEYSRLILSERERWGPIAREAGIRID